jgi:RNA polymerase sigma-70 factor (ECF subfamily)
MSVSPYFHQTPDVLRQEQLWVTQAKSDPSKFEPLYRKYYSPILRYLQQRIDDQEIAYDIASQVFIKAMKHIAKYEDRGVPFGSWLYRIAKSELYQQFREKQASKLVRLDAHQVATFDEVFFDVDELEQNRSKLLQSMQYLKPDQLKLIEMRFFEQLSFKEIGEELGLTENNAKVKTFRAVEKLRFYFMKKRFAA